LEGLELVSAEKLQRALPWIPSGDVRRAKEDVRPIFWRNRPRSYLLRTQEWDEFPNGRWGDSRSPAFGELEDFHLASLYTTPKTQCLEEWGKPKTVQDICDVFASYCGGDIKKLPWSYVPLVKETDVIREKLILMNKRGFLTINSQPQVNGVPSTNSIFGWGPTGGFVYQKAYVEFFTSPENLEKIVAKSKKFESFTYHAINFDGEESTNLPGDGPQAVTWGVFPGKEIVQPTIADPATFRVWKHEAFSLWKSQWGELYSKDTASFKIIEEVQKKYFLVNMIEHNYVTGDIFQVFDEVINEM